MRVVSLAAIANQSFTVALDQVRWVLAVKDVGGVMTCDITRDGEELLAGTRVLAGEPIIPYDYLQAGNFLFVVGADTLPDWRQFGTTQFLVYLSAVEITALRTDPPTVAEIDPFAAVVYAN